MVSSGIPSEHAFFYSLAELYGEQLAGAMLLARPLPLAPEIRLYLLHDDYPKHDLEREAYERLMASPPYWAFCWGGGQGMARYLLDNPECVAAESVIDFGAGSGVAAIAALQSGALAAVAVDIDPIALKAVAVNAALNGVMVNTAAQSDLKGKDIMLAADICYEDSGLAVVYEHLAGQGRLIVSDSRIAQLSRKLPGVRQVAEYHVKTFPDLEEHKCFEIVRLYSNF